VPLCLPSSRMYTPQSMQSRPNSALLAGILLAVGMIGYYVHIFLPRVRSTRAARNIAFFYGEDLYPYWSGSREALVHRTSPYSEETTRRIQVEIYGRALDPQNPFERDQHRFSYPLYVVFLMAPVAWLSFPDLRACAAVALPAFTIVGILLWPRAFPLKISRSQLAIVVILTLSSYSLLNAFFAQQLTLLVFFALSISLWCLSRRMLLPAGIFLAVATIKPQLTLLMVLFLLVWSIHDWTRRKHLVWSFVASLLGLFAGSVWLLPNWPAEWVHTIVSYRQYTVPPLATYILGTFPGTILTLTLYGLCAWLWTRARRDEVASERFALAMTFTLAASVVTLPAGDAVYDHILIVPGLLLLLAKWRTLLDRGRVTRLVAAIAVGAFAWQWLAGTIVFAVDILWPGHLRSPYILSAPLRTQPSLPFVVLALLGLCISCFRAAEPHPASSDFHRSTSNCAS
jgi:hypothetical protein